MSRLAKTAAIDAETELKPWAITRNRRARRNSTT
jgi:hypothetical protein